MLFSVLKIPNDIHLIITGSKQAPCLFKAFVDKHSPVGITRTFEVYYKHEDVQIRDNFLFKVHLLVDGSKVSVKFSFINNYYKTKKFKVFTITWH